MKITEINNNCNNHISAGNISFKSLPCKLTSYVDCYGKHRSSQNTTDLRKDLDYNKLAKIIKKDIKKNLPTLIEKFKNIKERCFKIFNNTGECNVSDKKKNLPKVTIYSMAGSDGTEAYAIANAVIGEIGFENAKKYVFPIMVSDVDENVLNKYGKRGIILFTDENIKKLPHIKKYLKYTGNDFFANGQYREYSLLPEFRDCFVFEKMDLQERITNFPKPQKNEHCISVIRNCLAQTFGSFDTSLLLDKMTYSLPEDSLVIFGGYDFSKIPVVFRNALGFVPVDNENHIYKIYNWKKVLETAKDLSQML